MARKKPDERLGKLISISDELERSLGRVLAEEPDAKNMKEIAAALREAVAIRRNLLEIPTQSEKESQRLARAKLKAEKSGAKEVQEGIAVEFSEIDYSE